MSGGGVKIVDHVIGKHLHHISERDQKRKPPREMGRKSKKDSTSKSMIRRKMSVSSRNHLSIRKKTEILLTRIREFAHQRGESYSKRLTVGKEKQVLKKLKFTPQQLVEEVDWNRKGPCIEVLRTVTSGLMGIDGETKT